MALFSSFLGCLAASMVILALTPGWRWRTLSAVPRLATLLVLGSQLILMLRKSGLLNSRMATLLGSAISVGVLVWVLGLLVFSRGPGRLRLTWPVVGVATMSVGYTIGYLADPYSTGLAAFVLRAPIEYTPGLLFVACILLAVPAEEITHSTLLCSGLLLLPSLLGGLLQLDWAYMDLGGDMAQTVNQRLDGTLNAPNSIGTVAAVGGAVALVAARGWGHRIIHFSVALAVAVMADQRSAYLALILALLFAAVQGLRSRLPVPARGAVVTTGALVVLLGYGPVRSLLDQVVGERADSADARLELWGYLLGHWGDWAITGIGSRGIWNLTDTVAVVSQTFFHAHNQALTSFVSGGVLALVGLVIFLFSTGLQLMREGRSEWTVLVSLLAVGMFESPLHLGFEAHLVPSVLVAYLGLALVCVPRRRMRHGLET